ncbi:MAG TPA: glycosyltransferase family 39 protein [Anaerolineae bacterium]
MNRIELYHSIGKAISWRQPLVWRLALVAILLLAYALRLNDLATRSLWFDEAIEYWVATAPLDKVLATLSHATHDPPLYTYLLHFWQRPGMSEFWLRSLSLLFSMMSVAGVMRLGKDAAGIHAALVAGLLTAVSAADTRYAQETGQYALMVFTLAWYLVFLRQAALKDGWSHWGLWSVAAALAIYSHYGSAIVVAATAMLALVSSAARRQWAAMWRQVSTGVIAVVLLLPLIFFVIPNQLNRLGSMPQAIDWLAFLRTSEGIIRFQLMGNQLDGWPWPGIPLWLAWGPVLLAIGVALVKFNSAISWPVLLIAVWITYYLISRPGVYFFAPTRHSLLLMPLLMATVATGIILVWRWSRPIALVTLSLIVSFCLLAPREGQENIRAAAHYWLSHRQPSEITYVYYGAVPGFRYQLDVAANGLSVNVPPTWYTDCMAGVAAPYCKENDIYYGRWIRHLSPWEKVESVLETIGYAPERLWLIFSHVAATEQEDILAALADNYRLVDEFEGQNGFAYLLEKR